MRKSLLKPGTSFNTSSSFKSSVSGKDRKEGKNGQSRSGRKGSRSRSRSPMLRKSTASTGDRGRLLSRDQEHPRGRDRHRSGSRGRPEHPQSKGSGEMGLIAQAREQMRLVQSKLRMDSPSQGSRPAQSSGRDHRHGHDDRGHIRKSVQDRIGGKNKPASVMTTKRNSNSVFADLDRAVKKAREERNGAASGSGNWDKKSVAEEEKNTDRWGHSGYEEMYRQDLNRSRSISREADRRYHRHRSPRPRSRTPRRERNSDSRNTVQKGIGPRRSRSPMRTQKPRPLMTRTHGGGRHISPLLSRKPEAFVPINRPTGIRSGVPDTRKYSDARGSRDDSRLGHRSSRSHDRPSSGHQRHSTRGEIRSSHTLGSSRTGKSLKSVIQLSKPRTEVVGRGRPADRRSFSVSISDSSRSRTPSPQLKRPNSAKIDLKVRKRVSSRSRSKSHVRSSSSESSSDGDVLELHPRGGRPRSHSLSRSSRSSSSGESNSAESENRKSQTRKSGSSSESSSSSGSESEDAESDKHSVAMAKDKDRNRIQQALAPPGKSLGGIGTNSSNKKTQPVVMRGNSSAHKNKRTSDIDSDSSAPAVAARAAPKSTIVGAQNVGPKPSPSKPAKIVSSVVSSNSSKNKSQSDSAPASASKKTVPPAKAKEPVDVVSAESESESETSSESDDEPRMTLSERFAKLTQMSTDKREFSKPEISASDIDTKLKVVKDLRSADTKVYVNGVTPRQRDRDRDRIRPKSPEHGEGEARYSSDDRRRHFERMTRDEPRDRPVDWSDVRVRYSYYKDRGYFNERPLSLEEYVKWEAWWYEYRDWLEGEGYYDEMRSRKSEPQYEEQSEVHTSWGHPRGEHHQGGSAPRSLVSAHRRIIAPPEPVPLMSRPITFGGRRGHNPPRRHPQDMSPPSMGSYHIPISRRIGHSAGGSLVVNIRQGQFNTTRGSGRLAGRIGVRRN